MSAQAASHGLQYHARAIAAQPDLSGISQWLAGTTVVSEENEVHINTLLLAMHYCIFPPESIAGIVPATSLQANVMMPCMLYKAAYILKSFLQGTYRLLQRHATLF